MKNMKFTKVVLVVCLVLAMTIPSIFSSMADDDYGAQIAESQEIEEVSVEPSAPYEAEPEVLEQNDAEKPAEEVFAPYETEQEVLEQNDAEEFVEETFAPDEPEQETESTEIETAPEETEPESGEEEKETAVRTQYVWNDGRVQVIADLSSADAIPDDAELIVREVGRNTGGYNYDAYMAALNQISESGYNEENTLLYDIAFIKDGIEIQPESGSVSVTFEFLDDQLVESIGAKKASDVNVVHLPLTDGIKDNYDTTADATNIDAGDIYVEQLTAGENNLQVNVFDETVTFETSGFSVYAYTVDFEYTDPVTGRVYTYNMRGAGSITLKDLAVILGMTTEDNAEEFISGVEDVKFSDESLVKPKKVFLKGWVLESLMPFSSEELLTITMKDGTVIEVKVTDVQESTELSNFLSNVVISGATQNPDGQYEIEVGKEYSIILSFAEGSKYQFDNYHTLTYQMPEGIEVIAEQEGPLKINIIYKGRTYQVDASFYLGTDGLLKVDFDQTDPDFPRLTEATDVSFRFTYRAEFNGNEDVIHFSDEIERDIKFDEPEPGQVYAEKSAVYDEDTGVFHYTITVTATGDDVTDVVVKDKVLGDALIVDTGSIVIRGNSSTPTGGIDSTGFEYTFPTMADREVITITYDAAVDFSKDEDGDGKITADQTKNNVSVEPKDGDPHNSEYSREINFKYTIKKDGTEAGVTETGDKIINWEVEYNPLALVAVGGDTITDKISPASAEYMKYYGNGITVKAYDKAGILQYSTDIAYSDLPSHDDHMWKYKIPDTDTTPMRYVITYQTVVDMEKATGSGVAVTASNEANDDEGSIHVAPEDEIDVDKQVESYSTEEVTWNTTLSIPQGGLTSAVVTDTLPARYFDGTTHYDVFKEGTLEITGLLEGESYVVDSSNIGSVVITFYQDQEHHIPGLKEYPGGRNVYVKLTTLVNQEWLEKGYEEEPGYMQNHTNSIDFNTKVDTATVTFGKPGIEKNGETKDERSFKFTLIVAGLNTEPFTIADKFDTSLLEVDTTGEGVEGWAWDHMYIWGGTQHSQISGRTPVSYTDTGEGIEITANTVPKQDDGNFYPYYKITYYLKLKEGVDLEQLAIANGGEYDLINHAIWADHETEYTYKVKYEFLNKELLNAGELGGKNRTAHYMITFNSAKATLNGGEPMEMKDVLSDNLSIDYSSIRITTDPAGVAVPYSISGGKDENNMPDGTTVATFIVPDSTKVVITYDAEVRGNGSQKIQNKVSVNGDDKTEEHTTDYGAADEGEGAIASFKIVKVDGYDANKKLAGVKFKVFAENPDLDFGKKAGYAKEIELVTDENGEIAFDGEDYTFYYEEVYHVQEVEAPEDYGTIGFDYLVTLTNKMAHVDYGHYIYYYSDTMQIKNWPLEGLVVEKQVESDDAADKDRYYTFRVSILNDDGSVNTDYNEKNGDDQFVNGVVEFQIKDKEQKMFWGFMKGTKYKVEEIDAEGFETTVTYSIFDEEGHVIEVKTDESTSHLGELTQEDETIIFKNSKHNEVGSLKIKKNVTVNGQATTGTTADGTYYFTVKDAACEVKAETSITITNGVSNEIQLDGFIPGTYTVSEDISRNPDGMALVGENDIEVEVTADETAEIPTAEFTNNKTEVGSLKIKKNVTVNGQATTGTTADGTYYFTVKDAAGEVKAEFSLTITNGASTEVQVDDLLPGTYTVSEDTSRNPSHITLVGENDIKVEVKANNTTKIPTAEFTNNYSVSGEGEIKVRKILNGRAWKDNDSFTFTISAPAGTPMPDQKSITITKRDADQIKSFGKIQFTEEGTYVYTVKETRGNIKDIKYDTKEHTVTIEVVDDGNGNLVAKEGTEMIQTVKITNTYKPDIPKTGDSNKTFLYIGMMIASILTILLLAIFGRKRKA